MRRFLPCLVLVFLPLSLAHAQETPPDVEKTFNAATALLEQKKYAEALAEYRKILAVEPDNENTLRNGAMAAFFADDYKTAQEYYQKLKTADPNDGFIRAKLVQVYQAMANDKARDTERAELIALHKAGKDSSDLGKRTEFCREQYRLGTRHILVYEPFVFAPRFKQLFAVRYQFLVTDESGKLEVRIEAGWDAAKKDAKGIYQPDTSYGSFYFDAYYPATPTTHHTMGLLTAEPSYSAAKAYVQTLLETKLKPAAATTKP